MSAQGRFRRGGILAAVGFAAVCCVELAEPVRAAPGSINELRTAAKKDEQAQYQLGLACLYGRDTTRDEKEAFTWFKKAADKGYAPAEHMLAFCYSAGMGTKQNEPSAFKYYLNAAQHGVVDAQFKVGHCYEKGLGVKVSAPEAVLWYQKAAEAGQMHAQCRLGDLYYSGSGVNSDYRVAAGWYAKAANQGLHEAQLGLAGCYTLLRDDVEAYEWLLLASSLGYQRAVEQLEKKSYLKADVKRTAAEHAQKTALEISVRQKATAVPR